MNNNMPGIRTRTTDIPADFFESTTREIINFTIGIVKIIENRTTENAILIGSGTLVDVNGIFGILTAQHVIDALPSHGNLGLIVSEKLHRPIVDAQTLIYTCIGRGKDSSIGPDVGFIKLPHTVVGLLKAHKSFYNITKSKDLILNNPPDEGLGLWCLAGIPEEKTIIEGPNRGFESVMDFLLFCKFGRVSDRIIEDDYDYYSFGVSFNSESQSPMNYGGVSGGGLWHVLIAQGKKSEIFTKNLYLSGLAFYQTPVVANKRKIRCHGRRTIYENAYHEISKEFS